MRHALVLLLVSCSAPLPSQQVRDAAKTAGTSIHLSSALRITPRHTVGDALAAPFPNTYTVVVGQPPSAVKKTLRNCRDYLSLKGEKVTTGSSLDDRTLRSLGTDCVALDWIEQAKPAAQPAFHNVTFRQITVRQLPPELALNISSDQIAAANAASLKGEPITAVEPGAKLRVQSANRATLVCDDWTGSLVLYAQGDFLGNGGDQLLIRSDARATGGTYTSTNLFLLARKNGGLVVVRHFP